jgi:cysteine sulfinate desulfinase
MVYLDSAATTHKPQVVIDAITHYYSKQNANVHRGSHSLTAKATLQFENAREQVAEFIGAQSSKEIVWTRGATEAINLVAQTYARSTLTVDDEIVIGEMEHHANIVPWQIVAEQTGAKIVKVPMQSDCTMRMEDYQRAMSDRTKIVAIGHVSNVTGTRQPIEEVIELAHKTGAIVVVDGSQAVVHETVNVMELDADFYVFSGHKMFAPTGIGALYGKQQLLEAMPVWHGGGKMVTKVSFDQTTFNELPGKFEAGTPNTAGAIALGTAIQWLSTIDRAAAEAHIHHLQRHAYQQLSTIDDITIVGYQPNSSVLTFVVKGVHHQDVATLLDQQGIAVRAGHHCAHPMMDALGVKGTIRASFALYNTKSEVDAFVEAVIKALDIL